MNLPRVWGKPLLILHLLLCCLWLYMFEATRQPADWLLLTAIWSIVGIQFTWGFTVGLMVGPGRANRVKLWWSLLLSFLPLWFCFIQSLYIACSFGLFWGILFFLTFLIVVGSETFCGVLLGAKAHLALSSG